MNSSSEWMATLCKAPELYIVQGLTITSDLSVGTTKQNLSPWISSFLQY